MANIIELIIRAVDDASGPLGKVAGGLGIVKTAAAALGGVIVASKLKQFATEAFESADAISDMSRRIGIGVEELSRLQYVADQNDTSFENLAIGIKKFQITLSEASSGGKEARDVFKYLELDFRALTKLPVEQQLAKISDAFRRVRNPADQTRVAVELFGRSGQDLVPFLNQGSAGIKELAAEADRLGITLTSRAAKGVDKLDESIKRLKDSILGFGRNIVGNFAQDILGDPDELQALIDRRDAILKGSIRLPGPAAKKALQDLNDQIKARERLAEIEKDYAEKNALPERSTPVAAKSFWKDMNPQIELAFRNATDFLDVMQEARETTADAGGKAAIEWEKFNEALKKTGLSAEEMARRSKAKIDELLQEIDTNDLKKLRLDEPLDAATKKVKAFTDAFKEGLTNAAEQGKFSVRELVRYIIAQLVKAELFKAIDNIGVALTKALSSSGSSGGKSSSNFYGSLIKGAASYFGFRAGGGNYSGLTMVGENGPELAGGSGRIWNQQQLMAAMGTSGASKVSYSPSTTINVVGGDNASPEDIARMVELRIQQNNQKQQRAFNDLLYRNGFGRMR